MEIGSDGLCTLCRYYRSDAGKADLSRSLGINRVDELKAIAERIKAEAREAGSEYDCIIGASGGFDSTYVIYIAKRILKLNSLVVKYDNGVCHALANDNLKKACQTLEVELRIIDVLDNERKYFLNATRALVDIGVFFSACFSCHYIIASVVYRAAQREKVRYVLTSTNHVEKALATASHGFMLKSLISGFFKCNPVKMLRVVWREAVAQWHFTKLKFAFDGLSVRFLRNMFRLHPVTPPSITKLDVSEYIAWDWRKIESTLRDELGWQTPRQTKVPYFRFDCHYSAMIDKSFKKVIGFAEHALLVNWFVQAGFVTKQELADDFNYMNDDGRIEKEMELVCCNFGLAKEEIDSVKQSVAKLSMRDGCVATERS